MNKQDRNRPSNHDYETTLRLAKSLKLISHYSLEVWNKIFTLLRRRQTDVLSAVI